MTTSRLSCAGAKRTIAGLLGLESAIAVAFRDAPAPQQLRTAAVPQLRTRTLRLEPPPAPRCRCYCCRCHCRCRRHCRCYGFPLVWQPPYPPTPPYLSGYLSRHLPRRTPEKRSERRQARQQFTNRVEHKVPWACLVRCGTVDGVGQGVAWLSLHGGAETRLIIGPSSQQLADNILL